MSDNSAKIIKTLLASTKLEELRKGLELVRQEISKSDSDKARELFELVSAVFYIDPLDHPELVPVIDEAVGIAVNLGEWIIPDLLSQLDTSDLKAQMAIGHALGRIGNDAIDPLMNEYESTKEASHRMFILFALGKIKSPQILKAVNLALEAAESSDPDLKDTATRAIGKFIECIPSADLSESTRKSIFQILKSNLADPYPGIRAKAIRSLGKLARYKHLDKTERNELQKLCQGILGTDENYDWDKAYIVRKEAEEALNYL